MADPARQEPHTKRALEEAELVARHENQPEEPSRIGSPRMVVREAIEALLQCWLEQPEHQAAETQAYCHASMPAC